MINEKNIVHQQLGAKWIKKPRVRLVINERDTY